MIELTLATRVLTDVIDNDVNFKKALKNVLTTETKKYASVVSALAGCELRHHLLFVKLISTFEVEFTNEEKHLVSLGLSNAYFLKRFSNNEVVRYLKECLKEKFSKKVEEAFEYTGSVSNILDLDKKTLEYTSIRFNTPSWLVKMWGKHFGISNAFKILKANQVPAKTYVRVNPSVDKDPSLFDSNIFEPTNVKDVYLYKGSQPIKKTDAYLSSSISVTNKEFVRLMDEYLDPLSSEYCMFSHSDDSLVQELLIRSRKEKGIYLGVTDYFARPKLFQPINSKEIRNVSMFTYKDAFSLQANISRKQEMIIINPVSSSFDKIRSYPDYLIHFKQNKMDEILNLQRQSLNELSQYLVSGGTLIYFIDTINLKEGTLMIKNFLKEHSDFELVEEKQCLPYEENGYSCYYAVLKMKINEND